MRLNRIESKAGPEHFKTYRLLAPIRTHRKPASCSDVQCPKWINGFKATFDVSTNDGLAHAKAVEKSGRRRTFTMAGTLVTYVFPAGENCFDRHSVSLEREPLYVVQGGDHRGNPRSIGRRTLNAADWVDDFANHQTGIADLRERG